MRGTKTIILQNLLKKIVDITTLDSVLAEEYLGLVLKATPYRTELLASVIAGILSGDKPKTETLDLLLADDKHHEAIAIGLLGTSISNEKTASQLYIISERILDTNNDIRRLVIFFYQRVVNNETIADTALKEKCLQHIERLCMSGDSDLVVIGLTGVRNLSSQYSDLVYKVIDSLASRYNDSKIFSSCLDVFYNHQSCDEFFKAVTNRVLTVNIGFNGSEVINVIHSLYENHRNSFDQGLIGLLIDGRGLVRFAGVSILAEIINTFDSHFRFSMDLTEIPSIDQYKLWVSLLDDDARVLDFMPLILPIFNSNNPFVAESLIVRIEEEIKNYGSTIYTVLEDNIAYDNPKKSELLLRIQKEMDIEFAKNDEKLKIKELDPRFTQSALFHKYYEIFHKRTSEQLEEQVDKSSIVRQLATTINLSKGGGWLNKDTGEVMELKKIAYEKQFPAKYFSEPENIDEERINKIFQLDWLEEFKECEAIISSYESTSKP